jgi:hypothetical protein
MTQVYTVGIVNPYGPVNPFYDPSRRGINPKPDRIIIDTRTGRPTNWQPGLVFPDEYKKPGKGKKILGWLAAAALVFAFRGKIKQGAVAALKKAQPFVNKLYTKTVTLIAKAADRLKPHIVKGAEELGKFLAKVRPHYEKAAKYVSENIMQPIAKYVKG